MDNLELSEIQLVDDEILLKEIIKKARRASELYLPGPYWSGKSQNAIDELKINGLIDFRGYSNGTGTSFADNPRVDVRNDLAFRPIGKLLKRILKNLQPFNNILASSKNIALGHFQQGLEYKNFIRSQNAQVQTIVKDFSDLETLVGCPVDVYQIPDRFKIFSNHYLDIIQTQMSFGAEESLTQTRTFMEIGGGFGANVHVILHRFKNIRKIVYLDISPNLYVAVQYLKYHFGNESVTFKSGPDLSNFSFRNDDSIEILCILPQDIENIDLEIDSFWNAHSFVEMTEEIVANYAKHILRLANQQGSTMYLTSYDRFSLGSTFDPLRLGTIFGRDFAMKKVPTFEPNRFNFHLWGKLS
jgi:putative sugar O-methyltransferase